MHINGRCAFVRSFTENARRRIWCSVPRRRPSRQCTKPDNVQRLAACPAWECTTPDNVQRPAPPAQHAAPAPVPTDPSPTAHGAALATRRPYSPATKRCCVATTGDANNVKDSASVPAEKLIAACSFRIPGLGNIAMFMQSTEGLAVCVAVPVAGPPGSWPFFVPSAPSPLARVPKGTGQTHAPRPPCVIRPRASVPTLLVNAQGRIRRSALALRPSRQRKSSTRMRLPPACAACTRCALSDWFRLRATRPRAP